MCSACLIFWGGILAELSCFISLERTNAHDVFLEPMDHEGMHDTIGEHPFPLGRSHALTNLTILWTKKPSCPHSH